MPPREAEADLRLTGHDEAGAAPMVASVSEPPQIGFKPDSRRSW